jgi:hypothetical protein
VPVFVPDWRKSCREPSRPLEPDALSPDPQKRSIYTRTFVFPTAFAIDCGNPDHQNHSH